MAEEGARGIAREMGIKGAMHPSQKFRRGVKTVDGDAADEDDDNDDDNGAINTNPSGLSLEVSFSSLFPSFLPLSLARER